MGCKEIVRDGKLRGDDCAVRHVIRINKSGGRQLKYNELTRNSIARIVKEDMGSTKYGIQVHILTMMKELDCLSVWGGGGSTPKPRQFGPPACEVAGSWQNAE